MKGMFHACRYLTKLDLRNFDTLNVSNMNNIFYECNSLNEIDISGFDFSKIESGYKVSSMFYIYNCKELKTIYALEDFPTLSGNASNFFSGCSKLEGQNGTKYSSSKSPYSIDYAKIDREGTPGYFTHKQ